VVSRHRSTGIAYPRRQTRVPQLADAKQVFTSIQKKPGVRYPVLVPNLKGLEAALEAGAQEIAIFAAASETFSRKNLNCSIDESLSRFKQVTEEARKQGLSVRGYVSCVAGCPFEVRIVCVESCFTYLSSRDLLRRTKLLK
jgi:hydroxymethylglutaryl-CoA lyase